MTGEGGQDRMSASLAAIPAPEEYGEHIARLNAENIQTKQALAFQAQQIAELKNGQQALTLQQTETKTLVGQVLSQINNLDNKFFAVFQQLTKDNSSLLQQFTKASAQSQKDGVKERTQAQKAWIGFGKYVIFTTIGALIGYVFTKGL